VRKSPLSYLSSARRSSSCSSGGRRASIDGSGMEAAADFITSPQSKTIKTLVGLLTKRKRRVELGEAVAEGPRMVIDLIKNSQTRSLVQQVVVSQAKWDAYSPLLLEAAAVAASSSRRGPLSSPDDVEPASSSSFALPFQLMQATPEVLDSCTDTVTNQGIVARVRIPTHSFDAAIEKGRAGQRPSLYVVLDGLQDPGNVGTLVRSCVATGAAGVLLLPQSADVWSPKALRSAMGTTFLMPIQSMASFDECLETLHSIGCQQVYAATMQEASTERTSKGMQVLPSVPHYSVDWLGAPTALVIGSEGNGLRREVRQALVERPDRVRAVHVPMLTGVESLNAGVCGSVILFEYLRQAQSLTTTSEQNSEQA
jgi:tRNA G18 (ribose-2'-O)-methylase SpoU